MPMVWHCCRLMSGLSFNPHYDCMAINIAWVKLNWNLFWIRHVADANMLLISLQSEAMGTANHNTKYSFNPCVSTLMYQGGISYIIGCLASCCTWILETCVLGNVDVSGLKIIVEFTLAYLLVTHIIFRINAKLILCTYIVVILHHVYEKVRSTLWWNIKTKYSLSLHNRATCWDSGIETGETTTFESVSINVFHTKNVYCHC